MKFKEHFDKNNLHHAYLIDGVREDIVDEIIEFFVDIDFKTENNPDFIQITIDNFKIDDALNLRSVSYEKSSGASKKIILLCANQFSLDAQNTLLKMFEEPIANTHFFVVVPDKNALLKTLLSRFYVIENDNNKNTSEAEKFLAMPLPKRIEYIKELLVGPDDEIAGDSARTKAVKFLNSLEVYLSRVHLDKSPSMFTHIFKVREFLRQPGSSTKSLLESVALIIPESK